MLNLSGHHQRQARACRGGTRGRHRPPATGTGTGTASSAVWPPFLYTVASATPALASSAAAGPAEWMARVTPAADGDLVTGQERRYNAPLLTAGTRLVLPADAKAVPVVD